MARYSVDEYRRLVEAFSRSGPDYQEVSKATGIDWRRCRMVYNEGWPATQKTPKFRAIKDLLEETKAKETPKPPVVIPLELSPPVSIPEPEITSPAVELLKPQSNTINPGTPTDALKVTGQLLPPGMPVDRDLYLEPNEMQKYSLKSLRSGLNGIDIALNGATGVAASATRLIGAMQPLLAKVQEDLKRQADAPNLGPNALESVSKDMKLLTTVLNDSANAMKTLGEAKKLLLGQPTSILGLLTPPPAKSVAPDEQAEANQTLQALFALGANPNAATPAEYEPESGGVNEEDET